jgi:radical SAM superfamily enzyme YgiQ (UPF0313 family)
MSAELIVLVDLPWQRPKDPKMSMGHASLVAALQARSNVDLKSVVIPANTPKQDANALAARILEHAAGASRVDIGIGVYVWNERLVRLLLAALRTKGFRGRIILGGPQISYSRQGLEVLHPEADVFVRGYGEEALCELVQHPGRLVEGVHFAGALDMCSHAAIAPASLPSPWLSGVDSPFQQQFVRWETQRGCPMRCSFCQHKEAGCLRHRALARDRILAEVDYLCAAGVSEVAVIDPIFNLAPHAVEVLERFAARGFQGRLSLQCWAERIDDRFLNAAEKLEATLELGLQTIHRREAEAVRRPVNLNRIAQALARVRRRGINHEVSIIFGLPEQTLDSFIDTVAWCLDMKVPVIKAFPLMLLRGTALDQERHRWDLVESDDSIPVVVQSNTFNRRQWGLMRRISLALQRTERAHPDLPELLELAGQLDPRREAA